MEDEVLSKYVTAQQACEVLGICRATLNNYTRSGRLRRYESSAPIRVLYDRAQLELLKRIRPKN